VILSEYEAENIMIKVTSALVYYSNKKTLFVSYDDITSGIINIEGAIQAYCFNEETIILH